MKLSIIIPVFNEEKTIYEILKKVFLAKLPNHITKEVIVINDGSTDRTTQILEKNKQLKFRLFNFDKNYGKGAAVKQGISLSSGDIILIQDADLEYSPDYFSTLLTPILNHQSQVVYGTRFINYPLKLFGAYKTPLPLHWIGNRLISSLTNLLFGSTITDMETCYKVFTKSVVKKLSLKAQRFDFEPEITAQILKAGYQIYEVPIKVKPRTQQEGKKISWKDGFATLWTLIKYRFFE